MRYINLRSFMNRIYNRWEIKRRRTYLKSKPPEIGIETTNRCNSKCIMCNRMFSRTDENQHAGLLDWSILEKCKNFLRYCERVALGGFGEPFLHPEYIEIAEFIKGCGPYVYCFTNGSLLNEKTCESLVRISYDELCISLGGGDRETHKYIRGIDNFDEVVDNLLRLNYIKRLRGLKKPVISFNIVAMNTVLKRVDKVLELAVKLEAKAIAMPNLVVQGETMKGESPWMNAAQSMEIFRKTEEAASEHNIKFSYPKLRERKGDCVNFFSNMYITWDGTVLSCPLERFILGDLNKSGLEEIWNSDSYATLRQKYHTEGISSVCPNCFCWDIRKETFLNPNENTRNKAPELTAGEYVFK